MLLAWLALLAATGATPAAAPPASRAALLARGDEAFAARGDPERLAEALACFARAARLAPEDPAVELRLARAEAFRAIADPASAGAAWPAASRAAERALRRLAPGWAAAVDAGDLAGAPARVGADGAEALYWIALATGSSAREKGLAAVLAVREPTMAALERVAELDGAIDCGGPHRALGTWAAALPAAAGGGAARARRHFDQARALGPGCLLTPVAEAGSLLVLLQDREAFERALDQVEAAGDADARWAPENAVARRQARELRARAARLF
jgi:hypothetical protein